MTSEEDAADVKMVGERRIAAPREAVSRVLNDPEVRRKAVPGGRLLERRDDARMRAIVDI